MNKKSTPPAVGYTGTPESSVVKSAAKKKLRLHSPAENEVRKQLFETPAQSPAKNDVGAATPPTPEAVRDIVLAGELCKASILKQLASVVGAPFSRKISPCCAGLRWSMCG